MLKVTQAAGLAGLRGSQGRILSVTDHESKATGVLCLGTAHCHYLTTNGGFHHYRYQRVQLSCQSVDKQASSNLQVCFCICGYLSKSDLILGSSLLCR